jgi:hypothetical protein
MKLSRYYRVLTMVYNTQQSRCLPSSEDGNRSSFRNVVFLVISNPDDGQSPKTQYLCVYYEMFDRQHDLEGFFYLIKA